MMEIIIGLP